MVSLPTPTPPPRKTAESAEPADFDSRATIQAPRSYETVRPTALTLPPSSSGPSSRLVAGLAAATALLLTAGGLTWWATTSSAEDAAVATDEEIQTPSKSDVEDLIEDLQDDVLSADATKKPSSYLASEDQGELRRLVDQLRALHQGETAAQDGISPRAAVGLWAASVATGEFSSVETLARCQRASDQLSTVWQLTEDGTDAKDCDAVDAAVSRDLVAATLRHDADAQDLDVTSVKSTKDPEVFVAKVRAEDAPAFRVWLSRESGRLRIKLFDDDGQLYAKPAPSDAAGLLGDWAASHPRRASARLKNVEQQTRESVTITRDGEGVSVRHEVIHTFYGKPGALFRCNEGQTVEIGWSRQLRANSADAGALAKATAEPQRIGRDVEACKWSLNAAAAGYYRADGDALAVHSTDGEGAVAKVTLHKTK